MAVDIVYHESGLTTGALQCCKLLISQLTVEHMRVQIKSKKLKLTHNYSFSNVHIQHACLQHGYCIHVVNMHVEYEHGHYFLKMLPDRRDVNIIPAAYHFSLHVLICASSARPAQIFCVLSDLLRLTLSFI